MSQENVELIVGLQVEPSDDWAWIVRDDATCTFVSTLRWSRCSPTRKPPR
jgi:hypothetical protein